MALDLLTDKQILLNLISAWAEEVDVEPVLPDGDPVKAVFQSVMTQLIQLQKNILRVNNFARASTCVGNDLDSWLAQFNFKRGVPTPAYGGLQFGLNQVKSTNVLIPVNTVVQTVGGGIQYSVIADPNQSGYVPSLNGYVITAGNRFVTATAQALLPGSASNVQDNQLIQFASSSVGADTVTNPTAIIDGEDAQTDAAYLADFWQYINSLSKGTKAAFLQQILAFGEGLKYLQVENKDVNGNTLLGNVVTVVDDGSGATPSTVTDGLASALDSVRAFSIPQQVIAASQLLAHISLNIRYPAGLTTPQQTAISTAVQTAIISYVASIPIGGVLANMYIAKIAIDAGAANVQRDSILINGSGNDLVAGAYQAIAATNSTVAVSTY